MSEQVDWLRLSIDLRTICLDRLKAQLANDQTAIHKEIERYKAIIDGQIASASAGVVGQRQRSVA